MRLSEVADRISSVNAEHAPLTPVSVRNNTPQRHHQGGTTTTCPPAVRTALSAGLHWLYRTVQPETALVEHRGVRLPAASRILRFLPVADAGNPVVVVEVAVHRGQGQFGGPGEVL